MKIAIFLLLITAPGCFLEDSMLLTKGGIVNKDLSAIFMPTPGTFIPDQEIVLNLFTQIPCLFDFLPLPKIFLLSRIPVYVKTMYDHLSTMNTSIQVSFKNDLSKKKILESQITTLHRNMEWTMSYQKQVFDQFTSLYKFSYELDGVFERGSTCPTLDTVEKKIEDLENTIPSAPSLIKQSFTGGHLTRRKRHITNYYYGDLQNSHHYAYEAPVGSNNMLKGKDENIDQIVPECRPTRNEDMSLPPHDVKMRTNAPNREETHDQLSANTIQETITKGLSMSENLQPVNNDVYDSEGELNKIINEIEGINAMVSDQPDMPSVPIVRKLFGSLDHLYAQDQTLENITIIVCPSVRKSIRECKLESHRLDTIERQLLSLRRKRKFLIKNFQQKTRDIPFRSRKKRAIKIIGDVYSYLFGLATEDEINENKELLENINDRITGLSSFMVKTKSDMIAMIHATSDSLAKSIEKTSTSLQLTSAALQDLSRSFTVMSQDMSSLSNWVLTSNYLNDIGTNLDGLHLQLSSISAGMEQVQSTYRAYKDVIQHKRLSQSIFNWDDIQESFKNLASTIKQDFDYPSGLDIRHLMTNQKFSLKVASDVMHMKISIPMLMAGSKPQAYHMVFLPFQIEQNWYKFYNSHDYIVIDIPMDRYALVSKDEVDRCNIHDFQRCNIVSPWRILGTDTCIIPSIRQMKFDVLTCSIQGYEWENKDATYVKHYDKCAWAIRSRNTRLRYLISCPNPAGEMLSFSGNITGLVTIRLDPGCNCRVSDLILNCQGYLGNSVTSNSSMVRLDTWRDDLNDSSAYDITIVGPPELPKFNNLLDLKNINAIHNLSRELKIIGKETNIRILDLTTSTNKRTSKFVSEDQIQAALIRSQIESSVGAITSWHMYLLWGCSIYGVVISTIASIILYKLLKQRSSMTALALPLTQSVQGGYAMPTTIVANNVSALKAVSYLDNEILRIMNNTANLTRFPDSIMYMRVTSDPDKGLVGYGVSFLSLHQHPWVHVSIMLMFMAISCIIMHHFLSKKIMHLKFLTHYIPKNITGINNIGEIKLIGTFIVEIQNKLSHKIELHDINIQICTLPRSAGEWFIRVVSDDVSMVGDRWCSRWSHKYVFPIRWGDLCVMSAVDPNLETCENMPREISLYREDILGQIDTIKLKLWHKIKLRTICKIYLLGPNYHRELYIAGLPAVKISVPVDKIPSHNVTMMVQDLYQAPYSHLIPGQKPGMSTNMKNASNPYSFQY